MRWGRIALAVFTSGFVSSLTDWLFMGDWLYKRYDRSPEIWRYQGDQGEIKPILWSSLLPFLTCGVFVLLCAGLHLYSCGVTLKLALAIWLIGSLPMAITNSIWMKLTPAIATCHALGWLVKLILAALVVALILG